MRRQQHTKPVVLLPIFVFVPGIGEPDVGKNGEILREPAFVIALTVKQFLEILSFHITGTFYLSKA
jgi:hypothetical protein